MPQQTISHDAEAAEPSPSQPLASWYAPGMSDGLGDRLLMFDNSSAPSLELLRFRADLADAPEFEAALREQVQRLAGFEHPAFARVRSVKRLEPDDDLALISNHTPGKRLSELLHHARGPEFAAVVIRQLAPALAQFHQQNPGASHGFLSPDRIVVSPDGRLTIVEHVVGPAIGTLDLGSGQLSSMGVALPPAPAGATARLDPSLDWYQLGLIAVSVLIGREVTESELPQIEGVLNELEEKAERDGKPLSPVIRQWLDRALQLSGSRIESGADAPAALVELITEGQPRDSNGPANPLPAPVASASAAPAPAAEPVPQPAGETIAVRANVPPATPAPVTPVVAPPPAPDDSIFEARTARAVRQPAAKPRVSPSQQLSPFEREVLAGRMTFLKVEEAGVRVPDQSVATSSSRHSTRRGKIPSSLVASLVAVAAVEAGVIAWMARPLWLAASPALVVETTASGEHMLVSNVSSQPAPMRLIVAPDLQWARVTTSGAPGAARGKTDEGVGTIRISSPIPLKVLEGERVLGSVPGGDLKVSAGTRQIELVNAALGYRQPHTIELEEGQTVSIHVAPSPGQITIEAPDGAEVSIDGQVVGRAPVEPLSLPLGEHQITLKHPKAGSDRQRVTVKADAPTRIVGKLR